MKDNAPILNISNLSVNFKTGKGEIFNAVKGITLELRAGETLALVGESGSGKSVTALSILRLLSANASFGEGSAITYKSNTNLLTTSDNDLRKVRGNKIAMIFQEPMTSLNPLHNIGRQITESLKIHTQLDKHASKARVSELLDLVGLSALNDRLDAYPHELSGGQRQRVMIAMALACEPDILIADEPTTALDVTVQAQVLDLLKDIQAKLGMAILLITHDLTIVQKMTERMAVMKHGELVEQGVTADIFKSPQHEYTKMLINAEPSGMVKPIASDAQNILNVENLKLHFPKSKNFFGKVTSHVKAVNDISLTLAQGETLGIVGESGSGKSTLGFSILRLLNPVGKIVFMGNDIAQIPEKKIKPIRGDMQIVFQDPFASLSPRMTVTDIIAEGLEIHQPALSKQQRDDMVVEVLKKVRLDPDARHRFPHEFSGGQRQRISIARTLILKPKMIVMDEPTSALDMSVQADVVDLLRDLQAEYGLSYIFISHDLRVVKALSHRVMVMKDGRIVEQGNVHDIFEDAQQAYTKRLIAAAFDTRVA
jgi:microcin C transport system ATP-binding protein